MKGWHVVVLTPKSCYLHHKILFYLSAFSASTLVGRRKFMVGLAISCVSTLRRKGLGREKGKGWAKGGGADQQIYHFACGWVSNA